MGSGQNSAGGLGGPDVFLRSYILNKKNVSLNVYLKCNLNEYLNEMYYRYNLTPFDPQNYFNGLD